MNPTTITILVTIVGATIPAGVAAWFAYRQSVKAAGKTAEASTIQALAVERSATAQIEAEAYSRAKAIYESSIRELEHQLDRLHQHLAGMNNLLAKERDTSGALRTQIYELESQVRDLEITVADLRRRLAISPVQSINNAVEKASGPA